MRPGTSHSLLFTNFWFVKSKIKRDRDLKKLRPAPPRAIFKTNLVKPDTASLHSPLPIRNILSSNGREHLWSEPWSRPLDYPTPQAPDPLLVNGVPWSWAILWACSFPTHSSPASAIVNIFYSFPAGPLMGISFHPIHPAHNTTPTLLYILLPNNWTYLSKRL